MNHSRWPGRILLGFAAAAIVCSGGCAGYRLGSTLPPGIRTIHVPPFVNKTGEPLIENETASAAIQELQKDGTLRVVGPDAADAVLNVTLTKYRLESVRYERNRPKTTAESRITITAEVVFVDSARRKVILKKTATGEATFVAAGNVTAGKRAALPAAARDLAHHIVESVVEVW
jgi:hypothetical protein